MTIQEIVRAAAELNISYGEYVRRYAPPTPAITKKAGYEEKMIIETKKG